MLLCVFKTKIIALSLIWNASAHPYRSRLIFEEMVKELLESY